MFGHLEEHCGARRFLIQTVAEVSSPNEAFNLVRENVGMVLLPASGREDPPPGTRGIYITDFAPLEMAAVYPTACLTDSDVRKLSQSTMHHDRTNS
jgi:hypothetical protein